jgi:hypothetical protein
MRRVVLLLAGILLAAAPATAAASFATPADLAVGSGVRLLALATDGAGASTALLNGPGGRQAVAERPAGGAWQPALPIGHHVTEPVVAAAGAGVRAIAWTIQAARPERGVTLQVREPGGATGEPVVFHPTAQGAIRHPAVAVNFSGDVLLAFNARTASNARHRGGTVTVVLQPRGTARARVVADLAPAGAAPHRAERPQVSLGIDGRGIVAWARGSRIWAAKVDVRAGLVGEPVLVARVGELRALRAGALPRGGAVVVWEEVDPFPVFKIRAAWRRPDGGFGASYLVTENGIERLDGLAMATDGGGTSLIAWREQHDTGVKTLGAHGIVSSIQMAASSAAVESFYGPLRLEPLGAWSCGTPGVAGSNGRAAVAWACNAQDQPSRVQAVVGPTFRAPPYTSEPVERAGDAGPALGGPVAVGLADSGAATVAYQRVTAGAAPGPGVVHVVSADRGA